MSFIQKVINDDYHQVQKVFFWLKNLKIDGPTSLDFVEIVWKKYIIFFLSDRFHGQSVIIWGSFLSIKLNLQVSFQNNWTQTRLKDKTENNSTWKGAFYQSEWAKINSNWVNFSFFTLCVLLLMHRIVLYGLFSKYWNLFYYSNLSF